MFFFKLLIHNWIKEKDFSLKQTTMLLKYKYIVAIQNNEIEYCMVLIDLHCLIYR